ncbi:MAG: hypothetical protein ACOC97_04015 [Myxococcota bacterium]
MGRWIAVALVAVLLAAAVPGVRVLRARAMDHYLATQRYEDVYYLPPAEWLPVFSLGYDEALADLIWMRGLVYFGDELRHRGAVRHVFEYGDAIVTLDPQFKRVYRWASMAALYNPGTKLEPEEIERARAFLERGVQRFPDDGELAWEMGALLAYELAPRVEDPEEKRRIKREAAPYLMTAAREGAGPAWLALSNASELERLGRNEQAVRHLQEMYALVSDEATREEIRARIARLKSQAHAEAVAREIDRLEARRREELPYVPLDFYLLVGPRPVVDEAALLERNFVPGEPEEHPPGGD